MKEFNIKVNGNPYEVEVEEIVGSAPATAPAAPVEAAPAPAPAAPAPAAPAAGGRDVLCPMPGTIVDIKVQPGEAIRKGQVLAVFEAMKMENEIIAESDATVAAVRVQKGDTVEAGQVLLSLN